MGLTYCCVNSQDDDDRFEILDNFLLCLICEEKKKIIPTISNLLHAFFSFSLMTVTPCCVLETKHQLQG